MELGFRQFSQSYMPSSPSPPPPPSSFSFSCNIFTPFPLPSNKSPANYLHVIRAQSLRDDEGNYYSAKKKKKNMVDANMSILSQRIEEMKNKERLLSIREEVEIMTMKKKKKKNDYNNYYNREVELKGWNYDQAGGYDELTSSQSGRRRGLLLLLAETIEIAGFVGTTLGLVFLTGSVFVFLLSLLLLRFQT